MAPRFGFGGRKEAMEYQQPLVLDCEILNPDTQNRPPRRVEPYSRLRISGNRRCGSLTTPSAGVIWTLLKKRRCVASASTVSSRSCGMDVTAGPVEASSPSSVPPTVPLFVRPAFRDLLSDSPLASLDSIEHARYGFASIFHTRVRSPQEAEAAPPQRDSAAVLLLYFGGWPQVGDVTQSTAK